MAQNYIMRIHPKFAEKVVLLKDRFKKETGVGISDVQASEFFAKELDKITIGVVKIDSNKNNFNILFSIKNKNDLRIKSNTS